MATKPRCGRTPAAIPGELPQQVEVNLAALERLNTQLRLTGEREIKLLEDREKLADGLTVTTDVATGTSLFVADPPVNERLERMKRDLKMLEGQFTSRHPDVIRMKTEIAAAEREQQDALLRQRQAAQKEAAGTAAAAAAAAPSPTALDARKKAIANLDIELDRLKKEEADLRQNIVNIETRLEGVPERAAGIRTHHARLQRGQGSLRLAVETLRRCPAGGEHGDRPAG